MTALSKEAFKTNFSLSFSFVLKNKDYRCEGERLRSFVKWSVFYISPVELAASGFYYLGFGDSVRCFTCHVILCKWEKGDDPMKDHQRFSEKCMFIKKLPCGNVPIGEDPCTILLPECVNKSQNYTLRSKLELLIIALSNSINLGCVPGPLCPEYVSYDIRLETFKTWPKSMPVTKENLTQAGFYYIGESDLTYCYYCGVGLNNWEAGDDVWETHAKFSPKCCYILMLKGQEYVNKVTGQEKAFQMNLLKYSTRVKQPLKRTEGSLIEKAPGPSHNTEGNAIEGEGSSSTTVQASKGLCSMKQHDSKSVHDALSCKICYNGELSALFIPCRHMVTCVKCAPKMTTCPVCRVPVTTFVEAILS